MSINLILLTILMHQVAVYDKYAEKSLHLNMNKTAFKIEDYIAYKYTRP